MPGRREIEPSVVTVVSGRNEFQLYFMVLVIVSGLSLLLGLNAPGSVESTYPGWLVAIWAIGLFLGGVTCLLAVLFPWKNILTSLRLEMAAMAQLAISGLIYATAVAITVYTTPNGSYVSVGFIAALFVASAWRFFRLADWARRIKRLRQLHQEISDTADAIIKLGGTEGVSGD